MSVRLPIVDPVVAETARTRLQAARARASSSSVTPYFGTALASMVMHQVPGLGTVATDTRWRLDYDPDVVAQWSLGECVAAWLHEVKHNLHRHSERFEALGEPSARHLLFNVAGDAFINEDLRDLAETVSRAGGHGLVEPGDDWVYLESLPVVADRTMLTEQVYRLLVEQAASGCPVHGGAASAGHGGGSEGSRDGDGHGANGGSASNDLPAGSSSARRGDGTNGGPAKGGDPSGVGDGANGGTASGGGACTCGAVPGGGIGRDCGSGAGSRQANHWWELPQDDGGDGSVDSGRGQLIGYDTARQVASHIKQHGRGSVPAGIAMWAAETLDPVVDWRAELRSVVSNRCAAVAGRRDYTYRRPSRRQAPAGVILPSMVAPAPPSGALVLDTSGSMTSDELAGGIAEIAGILKQVSRGRSSLQVIVCDAAAAQAQQVTRAGDVQLVGGGGTDMRVGMVAAADLRPRADFVVVFTDGDTPWPAEPPERNTRARYIAVLSDGDRRGVPDWMHKIVAHRDRS